MDDAQSDYEEFQDQMAWFTFLRNPIKRFISHYLFEIETMKRISKNLGDFEAWLDTPRAANVQVRFLAGADDVDKAKEILLRMRCVGLLEHFNASLLLIRQRFGLKDFDVFYRRPKNTAASREKEVNRQRVQEEFDRHAERIEEINKSDIELHDFAIKEIWPKQVAEYGAEQLEADLEIEFPRKGPTLVQCGRWWLGGMHRNLIYKPFVRLDRRINKP